MTISLFKNRFLLTFFLISAITNYSAATVFTVSNFNDSGLGSLRQAITDANFDGSATAGFPHVINFTSTGIVNLVTSLSAITNHMTINGNGSEVTRAGGGLFRIFIVNGAFTVALNDLSITNGNPGGSLSGGGIFNNNGTLTITNCVISGNVSGTIAGGNGGGIHQASGTLNIIGSTLKNNDSQLGLGGAINLGGGSATLTSSTVHNNQAQDNAGAIYVNTSTTLTLTNTTIVDNRSNFNAGTGSGGVFRRSGSTLNMTNSILANNSVGIPTLIFAADLNTNSTAPPSINNNNIVENCLEGGGAGSCTGFTSTADPNLSSVSTCGIQSIYRPMNPSAAINGGTSTGAPSSDICETAWIGTIDIGSVEFTLPGTALDFDGSNDLSTTTATSMPIGAAPRTFEFWFKTSMTGLKAMVQSGSDVASQRFSIWLDNGRLHFVGFSDDLTGTALVNDDAWHHCAVTYDGSTVTIYLDGFFETSATKSLNTTSNTLTIGRDLVGSIDEFRIWNKALCTSEITTRRNCELTGSESGLVLYYDFNQGGAADSNPTETTVGDRQTNVTAQNGTLTNFTLTGAVSNWIDGTSNGVTGSCSSTFPEVDLEGNGTSIEINDSSPSLSDHTDFGSVDHTSGTIVRTFTIKNSGDASMSVTGVFIFGGNSADFTLGALTPASPIAAGGSATFTVTFDPSAVGLRTTQLVISNSDCNEGTYIFTIQGTGDFPVPIELTSFRGESNENGNEIFWTTDLELNNDYFLLETSLDGLEFESIVKIQSQGNSNTKQHYNFAHNYPSATQYYRLKQVDLDGSYTYSKVIVISSQASTLENLLIFPNPTKGDFSIDLEATLFPVSVNVTNSLGILVTSKVYSESELIHLSIDGPTGIYFIDVMTAEHERVTRKVFKK